MKTSPGSHVMETNGILRSRVKEGGMARKNSGKPLVDDSEIPLQVH